MTLAQLIATRDSIITSINSLGVASRSMQNLLTSLNKRLNSDDPLYVALTQTDVDNLVAVYTPLYNTAKTAIQTATNSLP